MSNENGVTRPGRDRFAAMLHLPEEELALRAYRTGPPPAAIVPAPATRAWIEATDQRFARRCLPLMMANQAGWFVLGSHSVRVTWDGGPGMEALRLEFLSGEPPYPALSHFGAGILTFTVPYLFRTPPGWNLLARGPPTGRKTGPSPLRGWSRRTGPWRPLL